MPQTLLPDDLRLVAEAFDEAVNLLPPEAYKLNCHAVRRLPALHVMDEALGGVRDPALLRDGALTYLSLVAADVGNS